MLISLNCFSVSKSLSPVTRCEQSPSSAAAKIRLSSGSRQTWIVVVTLTAWVCRSTNKTIKRAWRGLNSNFWRSFPSISSSMSCEAMTAQSRRTFFHIWRQKPSVVRMASQTLLSRMMRTRQGESFFFGQAGFSRQTIKHGQQAIQFAFGGKKIFINFFRLLVGKLLYFVNYFAGLHIANITA